MELPEIVYHIAAFLSPVDRTCLAVVSRCCFLAVGAALADYSGSKLFGLAAESGSFRQAYWWLAHYEVPWDEDDAQSLLCRLGRRGLALGRWPGRFLEVFSDSLEDCVVLGLVARYRGGDDKQLLEDAAAFYLAVCHADIDWADPEDDFAREKLQMIIDAAWDCGAVPLHHNLAQRFGLAYPETQLHE